MSARKTIRGSENIALFYVFFFQRQKNGSLTIINLYSLGRNFPLGILLVALSDWSELY